jgi:hypothetical protein
MLTDHCRQLLAAYVDGELNARQQDTVLRLLHGSPEARELLRRMQQDAAAVRLLPRRRLERDLSAPVVQLIVERRLQPGSRRRRSVERRQPNFPAWAGFSAAAAALLLVAFGSYLYFSATMEDGPENRVAAKGKANAPVRPADRPAGDGRREQTPQPKKDGESAVAVKTSDPESVPAPAVAQAPDEPVPGKAPDAAIMAAPDPIASMEMFRVAAVTQPQILKLADLDQAPRGQQLLQELRKQPAYRMESPVKDSIKAFDRLKAALASRGIGLVIDQTAQARTSAPARLAKIKTNFVLYVEDVTPEELVQLFQSAAAEDRKAEKLKKGDGQFEAVVINAMTDADREELCKLLGQKGRKLPDPPTGPLGADVRKPVADKTADDIAKSLAGQGGVPRPEPGKPAAKPQERLALAVPYNPVRPRPDSPEIKRFLAGRKPPKPGTLQVLLVLRELGG